MKILAFNSSLRGKNSYTQYLIDKLFEGALSKGADCETIVLSEYNINSCTGCFSCQKRNNLFKCIYDGKDDVKEIFDKMKTADIIVFTTPVYIFNMSSLLKKFMERYTSMGNCSEIQISKKGLFFHHINKELFSKPFITIICQDNLEVETHKNIISFFKTYSNFMDAKYLCSFVRKSGLLACHGKDNSALESYPILNKIYQAYIDVGKELVEYGRVSYATQKLANKDIVKLPNIVKIMAKFKFFHKKILLKAKKYS